MNPAAARKGPDSALSVLPPAGYDAVIFDLGGVVLPLDYSATVRALSASFGRDASAVYGQFAQEDVFDAFERGETSSSAFRAALRALFQVDAGGPPSDAEIDQAWNALIGPLPTTQLDLLAKVGTHKRLFLLSNTNQIHAERFLSDFDRDHGRGGRSLDDIFEAVHLSHEMGMRKPERRIYQAVLDQHGLVPKRTVFLDDNPDNARAAAELGLQARHHPSNSPLTPYFSPLLG